MAENSDNNFPKFEIQDIKEEDFFASDEDSSIGVLNSNDKKPPTPPPKPYSYAFRQSMSSDNLYRVAIHESYAANTNNNNNINTINNMMEESNNQNEFIEDDLFEDASPFKPSDYDDFDTIDWIRDGIEDRIQRAKIDILAAQPGATWYKILRQVYRVQGWILITLIAITIGFIGGSIDISVGFLFDLKFGFCTSGIFLTQSLCCENTFEIDCEEWLTYSELLHLSKFYYLSYMINWFCYIVIGICFSATSAWLVKVLSPWAAGGGIPEVKTILGGFVLSRFNSLQTLLVKLSGMFLSVASGLSLGKEGPMIHFSSCVAEFFCKFFPKYSHNEAKKRGIISAAVASGVSVAFGAPIGGVLFSLEELSYYFPHKIMWWAFYSATIASLTLQFMNPYHNGQLTVFQVHYSHSWLGFELIPFMVIGAMGGIIGGLFIKFNIMMCRIRKTKFSKYPIYEVCIVTLISLIVSFGNEFLSGDASEVTGQLFAECPPGSTDPLCNLDTAWSEIASLLFATAIRFTLTVITLGMKVPAGLFIPSLCIGAGLGHAIGLMLALWQQNFPNFLLFAQCNDVAICIDPGVYALIGSTAMLGGISRMTVALVVIMFELTGDVNYIVPIMVTVMVAKCAGDAIVAEGIDHEQILLKEYPFLDNKRDYRFSEVAKNVMKRDIEVLELKPYSIDDLLQFMDRNYFTGWPIVTNKEDMFIVGYIARSELRKALAIAQKHHLVSLNTNCYFSKDSIRENESVYVDLRPWMDSTPTQVTPRTPINSILDMFKKMGFRYVLVSYHGRIVGMLTKKDVLQFIAIRVHRKIRTFDVSAQKSSG